MVSADRPASVLDPKQVAKAHRAVEPLHNQVYFVPETDEHLIAAGLRPGRMVYFAGRAAAMGSVGTGVVAATFYNFSPAIIARHIPRAWTLASPAAILEARLTAARLSLTRLLGGPEAAAAPEVAELAGLLREACTVLTPEGRALYAGHADLPWPEDPVGALWHGATLLREHRGDGHLGALLRAGLSGLEALITHTATGRGFDERVAKLTRGWTDEEWAAATTGLVERGLIAEGGLTPDGEALRVAIEAETDELSAAPWEHLGPAATDRVIAIGREFVGRIAGAGIYADGPRFIAR